MKDWKEVERDKKMARTISGFFYFVLAAVTFAVDQVFLQTGFSASRLAVPAYLAVGLALYFLVGWLVQRRGKHDR